LEWQVMHWTKTVAPSTGSPEMGMPLASLMSKGIITAGAADSAAAGAVAADDSGGGASAGAVGWDLEQPAKAKMAADATLKTRVDLILGIRPPVSMPDITIESYWLMKRRSSRRLDG
jgi:hypothetical protein